MKSADVLTRLQSIFDQVFLEPVKVERNLSAEQVAEWDSLLQISLVAAVEEEFNIRFRLGEVEATKNVGQFSDLIEQHLQEVK